MIALALVVTVTASAPHGITASDAAELIKQVETRLPSWITGGGDRKALLANPKELREFFSALGVKPADVKNMVTKAVEEQAELPALHGFVPARVLAVRGARETTLSFFDAAGATCEVPLLEVTRGRYVLLGGPYADTRSFADLIRDAAAFKKSDVVAGFEKRGGAWETISVAPPPPDCNARLKTATKSVYVAERSYFAEMDTYTDALEKIGVDPKSLGAGVKVTLKGTGANVSFSAEVTLEDGVSRVDDTGAITVVKACTLTAEH
jgi:hypothetical protein